MRLLRDFQAKRFAARATVDGLERVRSQLRKSRTTLAEQGEDIAQLHASEFLPTAMWLSEARKAGPRRDWPERCSLARLGCVSSHSALHRGRPRQDPAIERNRASVGRSSRVRYGHS